MQNYYIGMDVHKKIIVYCIKTQSGEVMDSPEVSKAHVMGTSYCPFTLNSLESFCASTICSGVIFFSNSSNMFRALS